MPLPTALKPWSFYRLGPTREKELFKRHRDTYDGVVVPAHIASYYSKFCSEFVGSLDKPYFIDPMTYIFANDPEYLKRFVKEKGGRTKRDSLGRKKRGPIKRSYLKLVEQEYGGVIKEAFDDGRRLAPGDFSDVRKMSDFVRNVVAFQQTRLVAIPEKYKKYEKYAERAGKPIRRSGNPPMCLVAPYFPTRALNSRDWYPINLQLVQQSKAMANDLPVFAVILADPQVLAQDIQTIAADYARAGADGFLLWPDGVSGEQDTPAVLRAVFNAVADLSKYDKPVILMYGGAFSLALTYAGLTGFACGICYGERKLSAQEIDVEGTIPPRYYIRRLKKKVRIETEAPRIPFNQYPDLVCNCRICGRRPDPATLDDTESREHFMLVRAAEIAELRAGLPRADFAATLNDTFQLYRSDPLLQPLSHLKNWAVLLSGTSRNSGDSTPHS